MEKILNRKETLRNTWVKKKLEKEKALARKRKSGAPPAETTENVKKRKSLSATGQVKSIRSSITAESRKNKFNQV